MLDLPVSSASSQLAELAGPFLKGVWDDGVGTEPLQVGAATATPARPSELTANPPATSNVLANETILTMTDASPRSCLW
jgi:hypothetical protein